LPYAAIRPLEVYQKRYAQYMARPEAITPYTQGPEQNLLSIEASRVNLRSLTESLLYKAKAALPNLVSQYPSGGFVLQYERSRGQGFSTQETIKFDRFDNMVIWLAKQVEARKGLQAQLVHLLDTAPQAYKTAIFLAWQQATGKEQEYLQEELFNLKIDPAKF